MLFPDDRVNYIKLLRELNHDFRELPFRPILSLLAAGNPDDFFFPRQDELDVIINLVDFVDLKTFDYYGVS